MIESNVQETAESVASHYDDLDVFYREVWGLHLHHGKWSSNKETTEEATRALLDHLFSEIPFSSDFTVCDIGCGYGETARYLARAHNVRVTGLSVSESQIDFARTHHHHPYVELLHRDWMNNGLPDSCFDVAFSIESSEHMPDIQKFFKEAYRVLVPEATFKICPLLSKEEPSSKEIKYLLGPICTEGRLRLCTVSEYHKHMEEMGFTGIHFEDITDQVKKTWTICLVRFMLKCLSDPKYVSFFLRSPSQNKKFLFSLLRIRLAYETKSMIYGIFTAKKPDDGKS